MRIFDQSFAQAANSATKIQVFEVRAKGEKSLDEQMHPLSFLSEEVCVFHSGRKMAIKDLLIMVCISIKCLILHVTAHSGGWCVAASIIPHGALPDWSRFPSLYHNTHLCQYQRGFCCKHSRPRHFGFALPEHLIRRVGRCMEIILVAVGLLLLEPYRLIDDI